MQEKSSSAPEIAEKEIDLEHLEAQPRKLDKRTEIIVGILMVALSIFQLYTSWRGAYPILIQRSIHLVFVLPAAFLIYPFSKKSVNRDQILLIDKILFISSIFATLWITVNYARIAENPGLSTRVDILLAPLMIIAVLESTRRILGPVLPTLVLILIIYAFLGPYLPGTLKHEGFSLTMILEALYIEPDGIFGYIVGISATVIAGFLIFGVMLSETGGGETFVSLAKRLAGRSIGGPAKVSCFSSAFFGTVSGSSVANVVVDGVFNIPLMKSLGYKKEFAAGVEATTSAGGQIVPPMMGAGAFIMAELLEIPFAKVAASAIIPALLYYMGAFWGIHFWAQRLGLAPLSSEHIPSFRKQILPRSTPFFIPVGVLIYFLSIGRSPSLSIFYAIIASAAIYLLLPRREQSFRMKGKKMIYALDQGGRAVVMVACLCACAQMIIGLLSVTGLGIKISEMVFTLSRGNVFIALILTMLVALILGMGIPTTAAYVLAASVCVPPLRDLNVPALSANMFVFYYAVLSAITPPICAAVYAASAISGCKWSAAAWISVRLALAGFIVPFMFYFAPSLLLIGKPLDIIQHGVTAFLGVIALSAGIMGYLGKKLSFVRRLVVAVCGLLLIIPSIYAGIVALLVLSYIYSSQRLGFSFRFWRRTTPLDENAKSVSHRENTTV